MLKNNKGNTIKCVFHHEKKIAFHSEAWGADIDALGTGLGWVWDHGSKNDQKYFESIGYIWYSDRLTAVTENATKPELIWDGIDEDDED